MPLYIENSQVTIPLRFELPEEFQTITRNVHANRMTDEEFSSAWLKARKGLHSASLNYLTKGAGAARSLFEEAGEEYPLSLSALQAIEANEILADNNLLLDEVVDRLAPFEEAGSHAAIWATFLRLENETGNFETQKRGVPYLTRAATVDTRAMIRMGEVQEQGFYGVNANSKRAKAYYDEGIRILSLLASQGLPSAAAELGHVYIEGLGTKQDIPRATRYFEFARKAGYEHPELWMWEHYGVTMRQVAIPENVKKALDDEVNIRLRLRNSNIGNIQNVRTCILLVREKLYASREGKTFYSSDDNYRGIVLNLPVWYIASSVMNYVNEKHSNSSMSFSGYNTSDQYVHANFNYKSDK